MFMAASGGERRLGPLLKPGPPPAGHTSPARLPRPRFAFSLYHEAANGNANGTELTPSLRGFRRPSV